jgi:hypothetical protein
MTFREILKETIFESRINILLEDAKNNWLRELGKNDFVHSQCIEDNLNRMIPDEIKSDKNILTDGEIFFLLYSIYLHDIKRVENEFHEKKGYEEIKTNFLKYKLDNKFEAYAVAEICFGHASETEKPIDEISNNYGIANLSDKPINLRFLAALLRLGDESDNAFIRVNGLRSQEDSIRNIIRFIRFDSLKWIIEIQSDPENWEDWYKLEKVQNYFQTRLNEITNIIEQKGLPYYQIWLDPSDKEKIKATKSEEFKNAEIIDTIGGLLFSEGINVNYNKIINNYNVHIYFEEFHKGVKFKNGIMIPSSIDKSIIHEYHNFFNNSRRNGEIDKLIIVVEYYSDQELKILANNLNIELFTIKEFINEHVYFLDYLKKYIIEYENETIFKNNLFVPISASNVNGENIDNLEKYFDGKLSESGSLFFILLGDFGTGKSTFVRRYCYLKAINYINNPELERIPILINLKDFNKAIEIEGAITHQLINKYSVRIENYKVFKHLNETGKLLIILDGFDEMATKSNKEITLKNFQEIDKLVSVNSKIILTCRTHYFINMDEINKIKNGTEMYNKIDGKIGYEYIFNNPLSDDLIKIYLQKRFAEDWEDYYTFILETYNLKDLAKSPVLLDIISSILPQIYNKKGESFNSASLYKIYTEFWLDRDDWRSYIDKDLRYILAKEIAYNFYKNNILSIHYSKILISFPNNLIKDKKLDNEFLEQDLRTCNFLKRDNEGNYFFVHKSFMEYFIAVKVWDYIKDNIVLDKNEINLTEEIMQYLIEIAANETDLFNELICGKMFSNVRNIASKWMSSKSGQLNLALNNLLRNQDSHVKVQSFYALILSQRTDLIENIIEQFSNENIISSIAFYSEKITNKRVVLSRSIISELMSDPNIELIYHGISTPSIKKESISIIIENQRNN